MRVRIEKEFSNALQINGGSPQGTLLGNLIFIIATSDLDKDLDYSLPTHQNYNDIHLPVPIPQERYDSPLRPRKKPNINRIYNSDSEGRTDIYYLDPCSLIY